jgi:RimJ/RimL family protein N-acetyltransferase
MLYRFRRSLRKLRLKVSKEVLLAHDLKHMPEVDSTLPGVIRRIAEADLDRLVEVSPNNLERNKKRLKHSWCYVYEENGKFLAFFWVQIKGRHFFQQSGQHYALLPKHAAGYHGRVAESARGKGIYKSLLLQSMFDLKQFGYERLYGYANHKNLGSLKGLKRVGFYEISSWWYLEYYHDKFTNITPCGFPKK